MRATEFRKLIREEARKVVNERVSADKILVKVIAVVEDEYNKGNKEDIVSLMKKVGKKTGYRVDDAYTSSGPAEGMEAFTVGSYDVLVCLADKSEYKSALSKQKDAKYTKIGDWWIRLWE